ncbi:hypothetical protein C8Q77DRAFT_856271 [Trametes polyzona]|nr:hypothetical protein C8Q77DRAFT_856271 [Trametes polyzona]
MTLRHNLTLYPDAPHGFYLVENKDRGNIKELFVFSQGENAFQALEELHDVRRHKSSPELHNSDLGTNFVHVKESFPRSSSGSHPTPIGNTLPGARTGRDTGPHNGGGLINHEHS